MPILSQQVPTVIHPTMSFKTLSFFAEALVPGADEALQGRAESTLKEGYPNYTNLQKAYSQEQYGILIDNIINRVLPLLPEMSIMLFPKNKNTYHRLLLKIGPQLGHLIGAHLFSDHAQNELKPELVHDLVFHYCRYSTREAGQLLNRHALHLWNSGNKCLADYLVEYGADVNAIHDYSKHSTLFHAVTFNSSRDFIHSLIDHGASYSSYQESRHEVPYTLMLITALNRNTEALDVLVERFPNRVQTTITTLETMLQDNDDNKYTCEMGPYKTCLRPRNEMKKYYSVQEIRQARDSLLRHLDNALEQGQPDQSLNTPEIPVETSKTASDQKPGLFKHQTLILPLSKSMNSLPSLYRNAPITPGSPS